MTASDWALVARNLRQRLGIEGDGLLHLLHAERRNIDAGVRDPDEPSKALTNMQHALSGAEFTPDERRRLRLLADIDVLADIGLGDALGSTDEVSRDGGS